MEILLSAQVKIHQILSILKQQVSFSSDFASLFSVMRHNSSVLFWVKYYKFSTKGVYQNLVKFHVSKSLKFCTLMGSFCPSHIKFQLENYGRIIAHDSEE